MARSKPKKKAVVDNQKFEYLDVSSRKIAVWNVDLASVGSEKTAIATYCIKGSKLKLDGAIVKPSIRYAEGDEARAADVEKEMLAYARKFAKHVYPVERIVARSEKTRMPELIADVDPMDAVWLWMKKRPPFGNISKGKTAQLIQKFLNKIPKSRFERNMPKPVIVRSIFGESYGPFPEKFSINVIGDGVHAVTARYIDSEGRSNRAGKSLLMSTMELARYGTIGSKKQNVDKWIHTGKKFMIAGTALENLTGEVRKISRRVSKSGAKLMIDDKVTKQADAEMIFGGLSLEDFLRTQFVRAGDLHGLLAEGSTKIKTDMMRWHGLDGWADINKLITKEMGAIKSELLRIEAHSSIDGMTPERAESDIIVYTQEINKAESKIKLLEARAGSDAERKLKFKESVHQLSVSVAIEESLAIVKKAAKIKGAHSKLKKELAKITNEQQTVFDRVTIFRNKLKICEQNVIKFSGKCPVDDTVCPRTDEILNNAGVLAEKREVAINNLDAEKKKLRRLEKAMDEKDEEISDSMERVRRVNTADEYLEEHGRKPGDIKKLEKQIRDLEKGSTDVGDELQMARDEFVDLRVQLARRKDWIKQQEKDSKQHKKLLQRLSRYQYAAFITSKTGIPAMQIENASQAIEGMANDILKRMGQEYRIEFVFEEEIKTRLSDSCRHCGHMFDKDERTCPICDEKRGNATKDVFKPMVREGEHLREFDQDSDGGKAILALSVRIALARHLGVLSLFLDEVDGHLDDQNLSEFIRLVHQLIADGYFKQIFVISHNRKIAEAIASNILVKRHSGWSEVDWE